MWGVGKIDAFFLIIKVKLKMFKRARSCIFQFKTFKKLQFASDKNSYQMISYFIIIKINRRKYYKKYSLMGSCSSSAAERGVKKQKAKEWRIASDKSSHSRRLTLSAPAAKSSSQQSKANAKKLSGEYFDQFDSNGDNLMSFKDVEAMLNHMFQKDHPRGLPREKVRKLMHEIDRNNDGKISKDEFCLFCKKL